MMEQQQPPLLRAASILGLSSAFYASAVFFTSSRMVTPILYRLPSAVSTDVFEEFYYRGLATVVPLTIASTVGNLTAAYLDRDRRVAYTVAAGLALATLPWTIVVMMPTIQKLLDMSKDAAVRAKVGEKGMVELLRTWTWMNFVRCASALGGGVLGLLVYTGEI